jgi:hypothetical protein
LTEFRSVIFASFSYLIFYFKHRAFERDQPNFEAKKEESKEAGKKESKEESTESERARRRARREQKKARRWPQTHRPCGSMGDC